MPIYNLGLLTMFFGHAQVMELWPLELEFMLLPLQREPRWKHGRQYLLQPGCHCQQHRRDLLP